jgi:hypothetical protein
LPHLVPAFHCQLNTLSLPAVVVALPRVLGVVVVVEPVVFGQMLSVRLLEEDHLLKLHLPQH